MEPEVVCPIEDISETTFSEATETTAVTKFVKEIEEEK